MSRRGMKTVTRATELLTAATVALCLIPIAAGTQSSEPGRRLTSVWRSAVVEGASLQLIQAYFDRSAADKIADHVRQRLKAGAYDTMEDPAEFARLLTKDLREVNGDLHLTVRYSPEPIPERRAPSEPTAEEIALQRDRAASANFGFTEIKRLRPNLGYIRFDAFHPYRWSESTLASTLAFLRGTSALVLDLRYNTGGEADMVNQLKRPAGTPGFGAHVHSDERRDGIGGRGGRVQDAGEQWCDADRRKDNGRGQRGHHATG